MKRLFISILILGVAMASIAMDEQSRQINTIKKSSDFLYGDATMVTQEEATSLAYEKLQKEVFDWAQRENVKLTINSVKDINQMADTIMVIMHLVDRYRVFAYVEKSKLIPVADSVAIVDSVRVTKSISLKKDSTLMNDSVNQIIRQKFFGQDGKKKQRTSDALLRIKKAKNFFELKSIMQPLKENGDIIDYGKYATAEHPELCYLIVYDPAGNICALLGKGEDVRPNLKTGRDDSISNYRGCGAIWFTLKEESIN